LKRFNLRRTHPLPFTLVVTKLGTANITVKSAPPLAEGEPYDEERRLGHSRVFR
jgi:hypothetical protein